MGHSAGDALEHADKTSVAAPRQRQDAERTAAPAAQPTWANDHRPAAVAQRRLVNAIHDGSAGQFGLADLHDSPRQVAQRAQLDGAFPAGRGGAGTVAAVPALSTGMRLPQVLQRMFESSLGADLSAVRLHTGAASQASAKAMDAQTYATGQKIHFAQGRYDPRSSAGEHLLAHEVAHTVQQQCAAPATAAAHQQLEVSHPGDRLDAEADHAADAMTAVRPAAVSAGAAMASRTLQRKVGFELEDRDWRAYIEEKKDSIRPAKRQELLYPGTGFDLEADDSMGPKLPSLEFVTVPFEPTDKGVNDLNTAFHAIRTITAHIGQYAPRANPFEMNREKPPKAKKFITAKQHRLGNNLLLAGGVKEAKFKMQATQGVSLEDLPTVMQTFGSNAPGETHTQQGERAPARELMYGERQQATGKNQPASDLFAAAPSLAAQVIDELRALLSPLPKTDRKPKKERKKREKAGMKTTETVSLQDPDESGKQDSLLDTEDDLIVGDEGTATKVEPILVDEEPKLSKQEITPQPTKSIILDSSPKTESKATREHRKKGHEHRHKRKDLLTSLPSKREKALSVFFGEEMLLEKEKGPQDPLADTSRLVGFLSMVMLYVKLLSTLNPGGDQAKYMIPFLARTSFPSLFAMLPPGQQDLLRDHLGELLAAIVKVANAKQFIAIEQLSTTTLTQEIVLHDTNFGADVALVRHPDFGLTSLTLGAWLKGVVHGVETLNPAAINRFLSEESKTASNALESFAVLGRKSLEPSTVTDDEDIPGRSRLGIFENRMVGGPKGFFTATAAHGAALNYLTYYKNLKQGKGVPGIFPSLKTPDQPEETKGKKAKNDK